MSIAVGLAMAVSLVLGGCGGESDAAASDQMQIVATTTIIGEVVANVVGDDATVTVLTPNGADPHDFQPSAAQVALINEADLVVANGLNLEEGLFDVLEAAHDDGVNVLELAPALNPLPFTGGHDDDQDHDDDHDDADHEDDGHDEDADHEDGQESHDHAGGLDPHFWFDPLRVATAADLVAAELVQLDAGFAWQDRADEYRTELEALDASIQELLSGVPAESRNLVTNHDSLGYLAERYGFEVAGTVIPSGPELSDPSSEELAGLVTLMDELDVAAIFADTTLSTELASAVAAELGSAVEVVELYTGSLGDEGSGAETLLGMLRINAERIAAALGA